MSLIEKTHINPNKVTNRLDRWSYIQKSDLVVKTIEKQLDIVGEAMYKIAPYDTNYMRSTITVTAGKDYAEIAVLARYAIYVHQGKPRGYNRRPDPFWKNSVAGLSIEIILVVRNLFMGNF